MMRPRPRIGGSLERYIIGKLGYQCDEDTVCEFIIEALKKIKAMEKPQILEVYLEFYDKMTDDERKEIQLKR